MQKYRINTNIGRDQKVIVDLKQNFELLQILSLKLTQQDVYTSLCADYGVVCGRISINNGLGVPNARVSIFIPQTIEDEDDPVISKLYPYKSVLDTNEDGFKYNLLPARKQHGGHEATGTFPDQLDILTREEVLQVYEKYYTYTVKTNSSGDFMIWGVPLGNQNLHVDVDLSDIGCFSLRPDDFIRKGYGVNDFKSAYEFKASENIGSLPQIVSFDKTIEVYPFWGSEDLCEIGITRSDFDLGSRGISIEPKAIVIGGTFTDTGKNSINKQCLPKKNMGTKCSLATESGKIEAIRFSAQYDEYNRPILEEYKVNEDINEDGSFMFSVPMNMDYLYTDEFGENRYTNDSTKGVPTSACYRFRFSLNGAGTERQRLRGTYLAPNIREIVGDEDRSYAWSTDYTGYPESIVDSLILNSENGFYYPQDYFYRFQYNKVYTVSSFQNSIFNYGEALGNRILGIKDANPPENEDCTETVTPPVNIGLKKTASFTLLLSTVLVFSQYVYSLIFTIFFEFIGTFLRTISKFFNFQIPFTNWRPLSVVSDWMLNASYQVQSAGQLTLPLIIYDDCEVCPTDEVNADRGFEVIDYCRVGEIKFSVEITAGNKARFKITQLYQSTTSNSYYTAGTTQRTCSKDNSTIWGNVSYNTLKYLNDTKAVDINGNELPRFYISMAGNSGSTVSEASFFISSDNNENYYPIENVDSSAGFIFNDVQLLQLFGIDETSQYHKLEEGTIYGYIVDRKYPIPEDLNPYVVDEDLQDAESTCSMYDKLYNESITQEYLWIYDNTPYGNPFIPSGYTDFPIDTDEFKEKSKTTSTPGVGWEIGASIWYNNIGDRLPRFKSFTKIPDQTYARKTKTGYSEFRDGVFTIVPSTSWVSVRNLNAIKEWYRRTIIGLNFCGGIVSYSYMDNWLSGSLYFFQFMGKVKLKERTKHSVDIQNYAFNVEETTIKKLKVKACENVVKYVYDQNRFYYRSCPYDVTNNIWGYDASNIFSATVKKILHPTTFVDLGPRDEFIGQICIDPNLDTNCSVSRSIGPSTFKTFGELLAFAINYKMDITNASARVSSFFKNKSFKTYFGTGTYLNGDIAQLISINNEAGIEEFDLQNPKYVGYTFNTLDPDDESTKAVFKNINGQWCPTPITLKYEDDGVRVRQCLNANGYLTESAQNVPFYLWDKKDKGFGTYGVNENDTNFGDQAWDYSSIVVLPLQGMTTGYTFTDPSTDPDDKYLLPPISYDFDGLRIVGAYLGLAEEFDAVVLESELKITVDELKALYDTQHHGFTLLVATGAGDTEDTPTAGKLFIRLGNAGQWSSEIAWVSNPTDGSSDYSIYPTKDPYTDAKQILSTPFQFYFGLKAGKTGLDKFIQRFGPKGAFEFTEDEITHCISPTPTPTPSPTKGLITPTPTNTPTPTPTPTKPLTYHTKMTLQFISYGDFVYTTKAGSTIKQEFTTDYQPLPFYIQIGDCILDGSLVPDTYRGTPASFNIVDLGESC